ncbi:MAG: cytochrome c maturation protein CcmE [Bacteroidota bacterium]
MKPKYIIGGLIAVTFLIIGMMSLSSNSIGYADITMAKTVAKKVQIKGAWDKSKGANYDSQKNTFTFFMKDEKGEEVKVVHAGARPNNFEIASHVVVKGRIENGEFHSSEILTKCPSKYEGTAEELKKTSL